jgi:hypothetical protein
MSHVSTFHEAGHALSEYYQSAVPLLTFLRIVMQFLVPGCSIFQIDTLIALWNVLAQLAGGHVFGCTVGASNALNAVASPATTQLAQILWRR